MSIDSPERSTQPDTPARTVTDDVETLQRDGVVGLKGGFSRSWVERMREDMMTAFWEAIQRKGGAVGRGPRRWYVEVHPEALSGFVELATHPWITAMAEAVPGTSRGIATFPRRPRPTRGGGSPRWPSTSAGWT